jgi:23S rRNA (guanosine2251-2'-O)-methyltransferase
MYNQDRNNNRKRDNDKGFNRNRDFNKDFNKDTEKEDRNEMLFGIRPIIEAIAAGKEIDKIFMQSGLSGPLFAELKELIRVHNIVFQYVPIEKLNRLTRKLHQGVICFISPVTYQRIEDILPLLFEQGKNPLLLILDRITDVRNFGAIARTAECAGVDAIIIPNKGAAQVNGDAIKTSAGALHTIPVCRENNLKDVLDYLKSSGLQIIACTEKTDTHYFELDYTPPTAIILGSEEDGISPEYMKKADAKAKLPLMGEIGSLNVSVANGVILYETVKQRMLAK